MQVASCQELTFTVEFQVQIHMGYLMNQTVRATSSVNKVCEMECSQMDGLDQCVSVIA